MTDLNATVDNMSKEELANEYLNQKTHNQTLLKRIDGYEQQLYETKRQLTTSKLMEQELSAELESIHRSTSETHQLVKKITSLEEDISSVKQANSDNIHQLEQELSQKDIELESLRNKVNGLSLAPADKSKDTIIDKLNDEVYELKSKNESLAFEIEAQQYKNKDLVKENNNLNKKLNEISSEVDDLREFLAIKREELGATNERFTNLQDELIVTQKELDQVKNAPHDKNKKGNSLFAEVEDNRQQLKKYIQQMNKKYTEMKISYNRKSTELQRIQAAYISLKSNMKEDSNLEIDQVRLVKSYEDAIEILKENIKSLERELILRKEATTKILNGNQKSNEALIEISRKEVVELTSKMNQQQYLRLGSEKSLYDTSAKLKYWRQQARLVQAENLILTQKVEDLEYRISAADIPSNSKPKPREEKEIFKKNIDTKKINEKNEQIGNKPGTSIPRQPNKVNFSSKYKVPTPNKQEIEKFCSQRTLTTVENDLLRKSPEPCNSGPKTNIPDLSVDGQYNISFEQFDDELSLDKPGPAYLLNIKEQIFKPILREVSHIGEVNKENIDSDKVKLAEQDGSSKTKRKVCFTEDTANNDENKSKNKMNPVRGGKILVPKKTIIVVSNTAKKI